MDGVDAIDCSANRGDGGWWFGTLVDDTKCGAMSPNGLGTTSRQVGVEYLGWGGAQARSHAGNTNWKASEFLLIPTNEM